VKLLLLSAAAMLLVGAAPKHIKSSSVPPGSYRASCHSIRVDTDASGRPIRLSALCDTSRAGREDYSSIGLPCHRDIANRRGKLSCG